MKKKISASGLHTLFMIITSTMILGVLVFALLSLNDLNTDGVIHTNNFAMMFLFLALSRVPLVLNSVTTDKSKIQFYKNIVFFGIYLTLMLLTLLLPQSITVHCIVCSIYFIVIAANRITIAIQKKKVFSYIVNGFLALLCVLLTIIIFGQIQDPDVESMAMTGCVLIVMFVALADTLVFAFARMQLRGLLRIMKKTYAFEMLYGLFVLIIASAIYFNIMEESVTSFGDGLWYSFMIVTTIGLGDLTVTSITARILSVFLGIYGLIVVAVITSIIVNFYNENKDKKDDNDDWKQL